MGNNLSAVPAPRSRRSSSMSEEQSSPKRRVASRRRASDSSLDASFDCQGSRQNRGGGDEQPISSLPMGGITTEGHRQRNLFAWCSWCYKECLHGRTQKNRLRRSLYMCLNCVRRTLPCRWCQQGMARGHRDYDDMLCAKCDGTIIAWGSVPSTIRTVGWCSWCYDLTSHDIRMTNVVRRNTYMCEACGGRTALCISCKKAFTRCNSFYDDYLCALCQGMMTSWNDVDTNRKKSLAEGLTILDHDDPYQSIYPLRRGQYVKALVDAKCFYESLLETLNAATESVFMSFWHLNPKIYLRRNPGTEPDISDRFDSVLKAKANQGVKFYIILWKENLTAVVNNFSEEVANELEGLHSNIFVVRHGPPNPLLTYYCHHQKFVVVDQDIAFVGGLDVCLGRYDDPSHVLNDEDSQIWKGVDYYNPHLVRPSSIKSFFTDVIDRQSVPRMPWHDIDFELHGSTARDVARNFVERWNHHIGSSGHRDLILTPRPHDEPPIQSVKSGTCICQVIRSMGQWSGASRLDRSIYGAYIHAVMSAQKYIYLENQYLSSSVAGDGVENIVAQRIIDRLKEKISAKETFRVIIILPQPEETGDSAMELLRWQYQTINRGGTSMVEQLARAFPDVDLEQYLSFFFLRQHGFLCGRPVTEKVFTHSKILLVDDRIALVSSANFNDRSLLGDRDSEIGVTVEDEDSLQIPMDGASFSVGRFPHELRLQLWAEHLGLSGSDTERIIDPICDSVYNGIWMKTARDNTRILEQVFPSIPQNHHTTMKIFKKEHGLEVPAVAVTDGKELSGVHGTLTMHPIGFLLDEEISTVLSLVLGENVSQ
uniref:phospholipase D n=1 Tax=Spongospora subterranea TaxID=70186 RepID=A0A0H5RP31_9EUKA|eukprot:CRZ10474.1 hypothetical protein [Spongospora subterranea]